MNKVELFINNTLVHNYHFHNLLDGLVYILHQNLEFDYIIVDDETVVKKSEFKKYLIAINDFYKQVYGTWYEDL